MSEHSHQYLLNNISVPVGQGTDEAVRLAKSQMKRTGVDSHALHFRLYKRSVDARKRNDLRYVCTVLIESDEALSESLIQKCALHPLVEEEPEVSFGTEPLQASPMVVGMGPAGLFASLILAENGYAPILIDRGGSVEERVFSVSDFRENGILDPESNIQFGAGGAGTFSDGKLVTRIHDSYCQYVLKTLLRFGAPEEIMTLAKPHVGTDILRNVVSSMLSEIEKLGGRVIYHCRMDDFDRLSDGTLKVHTSKGDFVCGAMILAPGHSCRDTYQKLISKQFAIEAKPISVGVRAEHLQARLDSAMYGNFAGTEGLGHAEYALSDTKTDRGVYTFCMCPGGEVVAAASEEGGLVVNGMSNHARNGKNANAAVAVSIGCRDYEPVSGNLALGAIAYQRKIERAAYLAGGKDYYAPIMTLGDFLSGKRGTEPTAVQPSYRDGKARLADFSDVFPQEICASLRYAFTSFGRKLAGYDAPDTVLTAAETRTSAPVRILRSPETFTAIGQDRIYPCGEGAGYAGGITSAAVDGLRSALALMKKYQRK